jgi:hypothetical protein
MNEILRVAVLDARKHLLSKHKDSFETELSRTKIEQILETGTEEIKNHYVVITFCAVPSHARNADRISALQNSEYLGLVKELRVLALDTFEFYCNFLVGLNVGSQKDVAEGAAPDLSAEPVLSSDSKLHSNCR